MCKSFVGAAAAHCLLRATGLEHGGKDFSPRRIAVLEPVPPHMIAILKLIMEALPTTNRIRRKSYPPVALIQPLIEETPSELKQWVVTYPLLHRIVLSKWNPKLGVL